MIDLLARLNTQQKQAVQAGSGPVMVVAGPGSGKTRVLTQRIAYLIAVEGVRPWQILAVTFTNKAAREMRDRVEAALGEQATEGMLLGTFHAICARLLRREADLLPVASNFVIFDTDDQERIVKAVIREMNLNEKLYRPASVHAAISRAKNELIPAEDYPTQTYRDEVIRRVYEEYQKRLVNSNAVDFDDLLLYMARLLENNPEVRTKYASRFHHVLVDEFQDTNQAQYALVKHLASHHRNIFCVGDQDQSIYRWRGADYRNIQRFEQDFPDAQMILLEQNYRSRQNILDAAMGVIDRAPNRRRKSLFSELGEGEKVYFYEAPDDYAEATYVVNTINMLVAGGQFEPGECAVMYRTNAMSRLLEEAFLQARAPYRLVGAQRFYGRREVKDMIAFLRLAHNLQDEASLDRVINVPPRSIGGETLKTLKLVARQAGVGPGAVLTDMARGSDSRFWVSFKKRAALPLANFGALLKSWNAGASAYTVVELFDRIAADLNYKAYINDESEEGVDRWENVQELRRLAMEFSTRTLDEFLENVALVADQDTIKNNQNAPTLLTFHAAKGLEFGVVFLVGLDDGILPHSRSFDEPEEMEEERRLLYVGITRAKERLYLVRAIQRGGRSQGEDEPRPSRFLEDIPAELLSGFTRTRRKLGGVSPDMLWSTPSHTKPVSVKKKYLAGMRVEHPEWGEGIILKSEIDHGDEIVEVFFISAGKKKLADPYLDSLKILS